MFKTVISSSLVIVGVVFLARSAFGALPGLKCIKSYGPEGPCGNGSGCNFSDPNNLFLMGCESDCHVSHNMKRGYCTRDDFCICSGLKSTLSANSAQCADIYKAPLYEKICMEDCQCIHKAAGGGCNFFTRSCQCGPPIQENYCPYKTTNEYFTNMFAHFASLGVSIKF